MPAIIALLINHRERSDLGEELYSAIRLGPTLFPIAFAAVAGRFFHNLARWCMERPQGIRLGALEQISGSQSLAGAVQRAFVVRGGPWLALAIILVWSLSPIGGQSSLRLFDHAQEPWSTQLDIYYANPDHLESLFGSVSSMGDFSVVVYTLYSTLLAAVPSERAALTDPWGRPKTAQLPREVIRTSNLDWQDITGDSLKSGEDYSSLLGIDVRGYKTTDPTRRYSFVVQSSYIDMDCERVPQHRQQVPDIFDSSPRTSFLANWESHTEAGEPKSWTLNTERAGHRLYYDSRQSMDTHDAKARARFECVMRYVPIEVEFSCGPVPSIRCGLRRQRQRDPTIDPETNPPAAGLPTGAFPAGSAMYQILPKNMGGPVAQSMLLHWPLAAGRPDPVEGASATDSFLAGDDHLFLGQRLRDWDHEATNMTLFSRRMTTAFNSLFQASLNPWNVTNTNATEVPNMELLSNGRAYNSTQATSWADRDIYVANRGWCMALLLIAALLETVAVAGLWLRARIAGPDLLGFASSLTRDNPYFPPSSQAAGSAVGGAERARAWRDMRVQMADVLPAEERGYIVFTAVAPPGEGDWAGRGRVVGGGRVFI